MKPPLRVPVAEIALGDNALDRDAASYVARVHRLKTEARLVLFDPERAVEADATLVSIEPRVVARVAAIRAASVVPRRDVVLLQSIPKAGLFDDVVRDATELGATTIVPVLAQRCVVRPKRERGARWERVAIEAARQSGRGDVPKIEEAAPLDAALAFARGRKIALAPSGAIPLRDALRELGAREAVSILIGPEGGLAEEEIARASSAGFAIVSLGSIVLRVETACAAALGAVLAAS